MAITKEKGDLGQSLIMADLLKRGYKVLLPLGEDWRFDLAIYRNHKFERVQCKYDGSTGPDMCVVRCKSCNNWGVHKYTEEDVDWIACYHKASDSVFYIPASLLGSGRAGVNLRLSKPKNNQTKGILLADNFRSI